MSRIIISVIAIILSLMALSFLITHNNRSQIPDKYEISKEIFLQNEKEYLVYLYKTDTCSTCEDVENLVDNNKLSLKLFEVSISELEDEEENFLLEKLSMRTQEDKDKLLELNKEYPNLYDDITNKKNEIKILEEKILLDKNNQELKKELEDKQKELENFNDINDQKQAIYDKNNLGEPTIIHVKDGKPLVISQGSKTILMLSQFIIVT